MKAQGFTLVELLAVIVILAVLALIATPVVLSIIDDAKESAMLRSAEMYLSGVENAVMRENMNSGGNFRPNDCTISNGNMTCGSTNVEVEVDGEVPSTGSITFENGKITSVTLNYESGTIVKDSSGNLVYSDEESDSKEELDMSTVSSTLEDNSWETIQKVVQAGKVAEAGWSVGDTKTLTIDGAEQTATIIGLDHDGENTATFMVMSDIGGHVMNSASEDYECGDNIGGWKDSEMRAWLNSDIYSSMSNKDQIKDVTKMTNNIGYQGTTATETQDKIFLLSVAEVGLSDDTDCDLDGEGTTYEWFTNNLLDSDWFWLRSADSDYDDFFFSYDFGSLGRDLAYNEISVFVAFVIG